VDGKLLNPSEFPNGTPYFELNVKKNKISGHVGCNGVNGSIKVEGSNITFGKMVTTKSTCAAQNFENKYLKDLSGKTIPYRIEDVRLILTAGSASQYVYRKMQ
jgi:heat shock protein HslJ